MLVSCALCVPTYVVRPVFRASSLPFCTVAILSVILGFDAVVRADDLATCFSEKNNDAAISACTAAINSGTRQRVDLAGAHVSRGNAYFLKG
jgi:hypothetical protein